MAEYQFAYDDGTMCVFNLEESQFKTVAKGLKEGKSYYIDEKLGIVLKLVHVRSIINIPEIPLTEGESYDPNYDPEIRKFLEDQRWAEESLNDEDDVDYAGGRSL